MSTEPEIDKVSSALHECALEYAQMAEGLATDPYFRDAVMKVAVSSFVWALYHQFDERGRSVLFEELQEQVGAIGQAVSHSQGELN